MCITSLNTDEMCDCYVTNCNHVDGCKRIPSQTTTSTILSTKDTSRNDYKHASKIIEGMALKMVHKNGVLQHTSLTTDSESLFNTGH